MSQPHPQQFDLIGVPVTALSVSQLLDRLVEYASGEAGQPAATVCYVNAHVFNLAWRDDSFRRILQNRTMVWPDGISGRLMCRLAGAPSRERLSGLYFFDRLNALLSAAGLSQFLLGGRADVVEAAAGRLARRFGSALVAGWHDGYFDETGPANDRLIERINASGAAVVTVGMGSPRQERWIAANAARLRAPLAWTVGALFDFVSGRELAAPRFLRGLGLEWAWRLVQDPGGKWRRYLLGNWLFVGRLLSNRPRRINPGNRDAARRCGPGSAL